MFLVKKYILPLLLCLTTFLAVPTTAAPEAGAGRQQLSTIVIVIDGLQCKHIAAGQTPNIKGIGKIGTQVREVAHPPAGLENAVLALMTGKYNLDGKLLNNFYRQQQTFGMKTIFIDGTGGKLASISRGADHTVERTFNDDYPMIGPALNVLNQNDSYFCLVALPQPKQNDMSPADNQVGLLLNHLRKLDQLANTHICITGTTGEPPLILSGPKIKGGMQIPVATHADAAATLQFVAYQKPLTAGMVLYDVVEPDSSFSQLELLNLRVKDLSKSYSHALKRIAQLEQEQREVKQQQAALNEKEASFQKTIDKQRKEINSLRFKLSGVKYLFCFMLLIFVLLLYLEYRYLKKRYLFFT